MITKGLHKDGIKTCILLLVLLFGLSTTGLSVAEESAAETPDAEAESQKEETTTVQEQRAKKASAVATPLAENLKSRNLGAAFKSFEPSEEISADNAVPYPVDI